MANELDELNPTIKEEGLETAVIAKQLPVKIGVGSLIFEIMLWVLAVIPGLVFMFMKIKAKNHFQQLQQKIQRDASTIDNYLEQRVMVLQNAAKLVDKAIELDKTTFENISKYRSGITNSDALRNEVAGEIDTVSRKINVAFENYPELRAHDEIADAMKQNMYLQREITAARELYNDSVNTWNRDLFRWPTKQIVAARESYTTRIPFISSQEIKERAKDVFF